MSYTFQTEGVCSKEISFDLENGTVKNIHFLGGCNGNLKMISKILDGHKAEEIISMCQGNLCGNRGTSCADQLSKAVEQALSETKTFV